ncbi:DNA-binding transcriptional regulator, XRE-family HTH domain [Salinivibrio sp. ES.052]|nr:DNA-binding transcriptional regulator, XRE-family HTH domain [Salinivibrio sp. ES.052]
MGSKRDMADATSDLDTFEKRLEYARKRQSLSQVAAAKSLRVARMTYSDWEKGKRSPTLETVVKISHSLDIDKHWLAFGIGVSDDSVRSERQLEETCE